MSGEAGEPGETQPNGARESVPVPDIRRALRVEAVQMHSVLIVATVDRGHGDSVGGQVGGVSWEQSKVLVVLRSAPIVACSRA